MADRPFIVITYPYPIGQKDAGGSRTTREIARHLTFGGADVMIMPVSTNALSRRFPRAALDDSLLGTEHDGELKELSIEIARPPQNPLHYQLDCLSVKKELRRILRDRPIDLVLAHYHEAGFIPPMLKRRGAKFGFLATWQTYAGLAWRPQRLVGWGRKWIEYQTIIKTHRNADVLFAISDFTRRELIDVVGCDDDRVVLCPLGVEPSFLEIPRPKPDAITNLMFFGRITPSKGFADAIEALGMVARNGVTDWKYRMFGAGRPEWAVDAAEKHGVADKVEIHDPVDTAGLGRELGRAHMAILPSHAESFGHSIVEAQASGIPVVSYTVGSVPEVLQDGVTGWLAPFQEVGRLAEHIERAIRDPNGTYDAGIRARERVRTAYTWTNTADIILRWLAAHR